MRNFVVADIHGGYRAFKQCLEKVSFDYENDRLVQMGDVVDGMPHVFECIEELLKIKHLVAIRGNHDDWFNEFVMTDYHPYNWNYGGVGTLMSYLNHVGKQGKFFQRGKGFKTALISSDIPLAHRNFLLHQRNYFIDEQNRCFVHGGFNRKVPFGEQDSSEFFWERSLWREAFEHHNRGLGYNISTEFVEIYIGHTPTMNFGSERPMNLYNIFNLDTGAGHGERLTIMDIDTKEYWQSDRIAELYPKHQPPLRAKV